MKTDCCVSGTKGATVNRWTTPYWNELIRLLSFAPAASLKDAHHDSSPGRVCDAEASRDMIHDTFHMLFVALITGTIA
jgi:hypothetical protein